VHVYRDTQKLQKYLWVTLPTPAKGTDDVFTIPSALAHENADVSTPAASFGHGPTVSPVEGVGRIQGPPYGLISGDPYGASSAV